MVKIFISSAALALFALLAGSAHALEYGEILSAETRTGSITSVVQTDSFIFNGEEDQGIVINMSTEDGDLDPEISLYAPDGTLEISSNYSNYHAEISDYTLLQSGTYTIVTADYYGNDIGDYSLSLLLIPGPTVSSQDPDGGDILSDETKEGIIDINADIDAYTFTGEAGEGVVINLSTVSGNLDPEISLYAPDGTLETSSNYSNYHAEISDYTLLQSGTYTIVTADYYGNDTGDYNLSILKIPGTQHSPSVRILLNQTTFTIGEELIVERQVINGPDDAEVEIKLWFETPTSALIRIPQRPMLSLSSDTDTTKEIFRHTFTGNEPTGTCNVGGRLLDPTTGRELSSDLETFIFSQ